ncbi:hypothetical protein GCK72_010317 [Caenorhabditis remanei]|uniref:Uncharacterized protein n=1 Tax=Caenorhabditis remanei TaxID=31234 RepID=A0A6A5H4V6_CAERE|nr:hypothetical protein GCK72_010317 [Caenorhabditis remanei]KAF1762055.1 hypothetical protein GCK72_010317 [Caenorhabditis remanei]
MSMAIFAIHFVYRYLFFQKSISPEKTFRKTSNFLRSNPFADSILREEYLKQRHLDLSEINYVGPLFHYPTGNETYRLNWDAVVPIAFMTILIGLSVSTVFYCGYCIYN